MIVGVHALDSRDANIRVTSKPLPDRFLITATLKKHGSYRGCVAPLEYLRWSTGTTTLQRILRLTSEIENQKWQVRSAQLLLPLAEVARGELDGGPLSIIFNTLANSVASLWHPSLEAV